MTKATGHLKKAAWLLLPVLCLADECEKPPLARGGFLFRTHFMDIYFYEINGNRIRKMVQFQLKL